MPKDWGSLRELFAGGDFSPEDLGKWIEMGGTMDEISQIMQIMQGQQGLTQLQEQSALQPVRMELMRGMGEQLGQPPPNPYMNMPTALPRLPGVGEGGLGSTPAGPSGMGMPDYGDLRTRLMAAFQGEPTLEGTEPGDGDQYTVTPDEGILIEDEEEEGEEGKKKQGTT